MEFAYWEDSVSLILKKKKSAGQTVWKVMNAARFVFILGLLIPLLYVLIVNILLHIHVAPVDIVMTGFLFLGVGGVIIYVFSGFVLMFVMVDWRWLLASILLVVLGFLGGAPFWIYRYLKGKEIRKSDWKPR